MTYFRDSEVGKQFFVSLVSSALRDWLALCYETGIYAMRPGKRLCFGC